MGTKGIEQKTGYQPTPPPTHAAGLETGPTLRDPLAEALGLISLADARGLQVRLMGGLAFHALMPTWTARISRDGRDIDLATRSRDQRAVADLLAASGYAPDKQYNALYGHKQLYFADLRDGRPVDVLVDRLEMCHRFEFADRLTAHHPTPPPRGAPPVHLHRREHQHQEH